MLRIYLGRHGQTDWNAELRLQGWTDIPLNETGRRQARELAARLRGIPLECVYCSSLRRSRETAELLAVEGAAVVALQDLNEQSLGKYEGTVLSGEELAEFQRRRLDANDTLEGGESRNQHLARVRRAIEFIRSRHRAGGNVLVIGHGGTNNLILQTLIGPTADVTFRFTNTELYQIELPDGGPPILWKQEPRPQDI